MKTNYEQYSGRGRSDVKSPRQKVLGDLLREAREEMDWTRERLSHATGIGTSSIVRYELAGKEEEGQYPRSPALAKLCIALKLDPLKCLLACLPNEDYGMYESLSNGQAWRYNHPQYEWIEQQLNSVTKDLMLLRSFIQHFLPYLDNENLPEELHWLLDKGKEEFDRITDLETRLLQMGVFILPMGSFLMPSSYTDEEGLKDFFDFGKPGIFHGKGCAPSIVQRTLTYYAGRFTQLAHQFEHREEERDKHADIFNMLNALRGEKNSEDDLPSPPSSKDDQF